MAGCGLESRMTAVWGSGVSTASTGSNMVLRGGWLDSMMEKATSSEVTGLPSWNTASGTRWSVRLFLSSEKDHELARYGSGFQSRS